MTSAAEIDALLPQTQCRQCGFDGCQPYAEALAANQADINRCPPGGDTGIKKLSQLLGRPLLPLDPACGEQGPHRIACIDESACIGCAKCLPVCPTDAILGASRFLHTVLAPFCTGCGLCIPPCPVDCITLVEDARFPALPPPDGSRRRFQFHRLRLERDAQERVQQLALRERSVTGV